MFRAIEIKQSKYKKTLRSERYRLAGLAIIVLVGAALRFWQLDAKPLWLDEVIGALLSLGRTLNDVPLNQYISLSALDELFSLESGKRCADIANAVATDSVHPPVYFCLMYRWMSSVPPGVESWIGWLRSLPAIVGVLCIPVVYSLNRLAFSPAAGLTAAAMMAVSPFAVYLSQEARHYTLPMLLTLLALVGLVKLQQALLHNLRIHSGHLAVWAIVNSIGMYVHYFYILDVLAQVGALVGWFVLFGRHRVEALAGLRRNSRRLLITLAAIAISYAPWLPTLIGHFSRPETDWLKPYKPDWSDRVAPLYQTLSGGLLTVVALPIEDQPWEVVILSALLMLGIGGWVLWRAARGWRSLWLTLPEQRSGLLLMGGFVGCVLIQFFAITYILDKDVTSVPRYNFVYYPGMAALLAVGLVTQLRPNEFATSDATQSAGELTHPSLSPVSSSAKPVGVALIAGVLSSILVVYGIVFQKGYYPDQVAQDLAFEGDRPVILAVTYESLQEVGLGLSFALALQDQYDKMEIATPPVRLVFLDRSKGFGMAWRSLARLDQELPLPLNLWVVASPGMKTEDYPQTLRVRRPNRRGRVLCPIDPSGFNRIGFPYQLFRCQPQRRAGS